MHQSHSKNKNMNKRAAAASQKSSKKPKMDTSLVISLCLFAIILSLFGGLSLFSAEDTDPADDATASVDAL